MGEQTELYPEPEVPVMMSGGLATMASLYQTSTHLLDDATEPGCAGTHQEYLALGASVPSVGESYRSSPSPGMQSDLYPCSPTSPLLTPAQRQLASVGQPAVFSMYTDHQACPTTALPGAGQAELSPAPDSPLGLEGTELDMEQLALFVKTEIEKNEGATECLAAESTVGSTTSHTSLHALNPPVYIKSEPTDEDEEDACSISSSTSMAKVMPRSPQQPGQKRRGGRPRDPVVYGVGWFFGYSIEHVKTS